MPGILNHQNGKTEILKGEDSDSRRQRLLVAVEHQLLQTQARTNSTSLPTTSRCGRRGADVDIFRTEQIKSKDEPNTGLNGLLIMNHRPLRFLVLYLVAPSSFVLALAPLPFSLAPEPEPEIYNSSKTPSDLPWNTYNYCNAPHVHTGTYSPPKIPNSSLKHVTLVMRHHKVWPLSL